MTVHSPFSDILGTVFGSDASVRVVRELCNAEAPLGRAEIARRSGLSLPGVGYALEKLYRASVVEFVGSGARQSVQMRARHPLAAHLSLLFFVERGYGEKVVDQMRRVLEGVKPAPRAAWIAKGDGPAPAVLTVLVGARDVAATREQLRGAVAEAQAELDVAIQVQVVTEAEIETATGEARTAWERATPVYGTGPAGVARTDSRAISPATHQARDAAALGRGVWIARQLERDPTLVKRARQWLVKRLPEVSPREEHELREWLDVLDTSSVPRIQHVLSDPGERGTRLRQSNPFIHALSERERARIRKETEP